MKKSKIFNLKRHSSGNDRDITFPDLNTATLTIAEMYDGKYAIMANDSEILFFIETGSDAINALRCLNWMKRYVTDVLTATSFNLSDIESQRLVDKAGLDEKIKSIMQERQQKGYTQK